jgi:hypothetical protein
MPNAAIASRQDVLMSIGILLAELREDLVRRPLSRDVRDEAAPGR